MVTVAENQVADADLLTDKSNLRPHIKMAVETTPAVDVHTHVVPPEFNGLFLSGIDDLLSYHYLIAETFRSTNVSYARFWTMTKTQRADLVWKTLFVDNTPLSEAARGIISILEAFQLNTRALNLEEARDFFARQKSHQHLERVLSMARVSDVVMTNDPFPEQEREIWETGISFDSRFHASLRLDSLLNDWPNARELLSQQDFAVSLVPDSESIATVRRFLDSWIERMRPVYMAVSLPADFQFPANDVRDLLLRSAVLPAAQEHALPLALMIGVKRGVNPALSAAGDGVGRADVAALEHLCAEYPSAKFLATLLSRENQHELCVVARKFNNLMPFGCWWFLNNPSIVAEITHERLELLGPSFIPQHSDARVLEQLVYKWRHARASVAAVLIETYERLLDAGRAVTAEEIQRDIRRMFSGNFCNWVGRPQSASNAGILGKE